MRTAWIAAAALLPLGSCAGDGGTTSRPAALALLESAREPATPDRFEIWICRIPSDTTDPSYVSGGERLALTTSDLVDRIAPAVGAYFDELGHGAYSIGFVAGGEVALAAGDDHQRCVEEALDRSGPATDAVLVVADAEHRADAPGGTGQSGTGCVCPARESRRSAYVGASDFRPDWGEEPPLDLVEHEIGHTLGLPHSAGPDSVEYTSALDVMSDSAAPRGADPSRRDAQATIAANLIALGWVPPGDVAVVPEDGATVTLRPSTDDTGQRAAVVALDDTRLLTVELLTPDGLDVHLPAAGVAIHLVDQSAAVCGHLDGDPCTGIERRQVVLDGRHSAHRSARRRRRADGHGLDGARRTTRRRVRHAGAATYRAVTLRHEGARPAVGDADVLGPLDGEGLERAVPHQPGQGPDRAVDRLRPADPDRLRPRPSPRPRRGRQGRRTGRAPRPRAHPARRHPAGADEHVDDDQRDRGVVAGPVRRQRRRAGHARRGAARHDAERHRQGVPVARHVHLPARAEPPADRRHGRVVRAPRAALEPDERLQLPPAGGGRDAGPGDRLLAGDGDRGARRGARLRAGRAGAIPAGVRFDLVLRQRRHPLRRGDVQAAGVHRAVGSHRPRALRRDRCEGPPLPVRRAGELPRPHRGPTREQRATDRARDAGRHVVEAGSGTQRAAPGLERGARASPPVGPAVVIADATGARLRERSPGVRRHLRRQPRGHRGHCRDLRGGVGRAAGRAVARGRVRGGRRAEGPARPLDGGQDPRHRVRRPGRDRGQPVHRVRTVTARRRGQHPEGRSRRRGGAGR